VTWAVAWRPVAEGDLTDCAAYIAEDNVDAALRFVDAVEETVAALAESPMLGTATHFAHPELAGLRRRVVNRFKRYLISTEVNQQHRRLSSCAFSPGSATFLARWSSGSSLGHALGC